jgi:hypothetical protein
MSPEDAKDGAHAPSTTNDLDQSAAEQSRTQKSKFRFKSSKRKLDYDGDHSSSTRGEGDRHRHHHHRSKRRKQSGPPDNPALYDDSHPPNAPSEQYLDPDTAFRESLFDAMADDEGAQFWEGVYGQPIPKIPPVKQGPKGELEAMTEEEYAAHVRAEMYKKTHQYLFEEKARREQAKKERERLAQQARQEEAASEQFKRVVDESLKRGRERKERAQRAAEWAGKWTAYKKLWDELGDRSKSGGMKIPWPVWHGTRENISKEEIETFFLNGPTSGKPDQADLFRTLKAERVRWHPDKMQQKLGGQGADEVNMWAITAVFQIVDQMWSELRDSKG